MRDFYEDLWERLPERLSPPDLDLRGGFLLDHLQPGQRLLDLGSGDGVFCELLAEPAAESGLSITAADVSATALARLSRRARLPAGLSTVQVPFDGELPFDDNAFDLIWASEVIEHVADTARWLSEVRRILAPGATLLLSTPNHSRLRLLVGGVGVYSPPLGDHLHLYDRRSLTTVLEEFGFGSVSVRARGGGPGALARLLLAEARR